MLLGLDHVVIAVRDLSEASRTLERALGLVVSPGGQHPGAGTHNSIVRFGVDYLELISVRDPQEAKASNRGEYIVDFLKQGEGLLGFVIGSDDLEADMTAAAGRGIYLTGPTHGSRQRPDGTVMEWDRAFVGNDPWGHTLPFVIQHYTPIEGRRSWAPPGGHPLKVTRVPLVSVAVSSLDATIQQYEGLFGQPPVVVEDVPALPARRARFQVGDLQVDLLEPAASNGGLADFVRYQGDGLFMVSLAVPDVDEAVQLLRERGTAAGKPTFRRRAPLLDHSQTLGARFQLIEER